MEELQRFANDKSEGRTKRPFRWLPLAANSLIGTFFGAVVAGFLINRIPERRQVAVFLALLLVLAPACSFLWHWIFHLRPLQLEKKLKSREAGPGGFGPIHPE